MYILAVDCGSTNLKMALCTPDFSRISSASAAVAYSRDDGMARELDGTVLWETFLDLLDRVTSMGGVCTGSIGTISMASQAQTFALCNEKGELLTPFYSWMDRRAEVEAAEVDQVLGGEFHRHCSFYPVIPQLQICKAVWLRKQLGRWPDHSSCVFLPGFFALRLGAGNFVDDNLAAMGGLYSLQENHWWNAALDLAGMTVAQLPKVVSVGEPVRLTEMITETGISRDCKVVFAGNDQTAGAVGCGCSPQVMVVTLGTALVVYRYAGEKPGPFNRTGCWGPYPGGGYYELGAMDEGCCSLDWAVRRLLGRQDLKRFDDLAEKARSEHLSHLETVPFFFPSKMNRNDAWDTPIDNRFGRFAYAVLEGIAFSLKLLISENLGVGSMPDEIRITGGGSNSAVWLQIIADVLGCRVRLGRGDAILGAALIAAGRTTVPSLEEDMVYDPSPPYVAKEKNRYAEWLDKKQ